VPLYILGSSMFGARLAAALGLPYAFASHFSPALLQQAVSRYRDEFTPSAQLDAPYVIAGVNVVAAASSEVAHRRFDVHRRSLTRSLVSRSTGGADYSDEEIDAFLATPNGRQVASMMTYTAVGDPVEVHAYLASFAEEAQADELILAHQSALTEDRLESVALTADAVLGVSV
jgi:luciferase family oxidoreductase group 1